MPKTGYSCFLNLQKQANSLAHEARTDQSPLVLGLFSHKTTLARSWGRRSPAMGFGRKFFVSAS